MATEFSKHNIPLNYYDKKSRQELDFIYPQGSKINIIEVKSGNDYKKHASLDAAINTYNTINEAIVLCTSNVEHSDGILYLPLYMTMFL